MNLPPGFVLESQPQQQANAPALPEGFVLENRPQNMDQLWGNLPRDPGPAQQPRTAIDGEVANVLSREAQGEGPQGRNARVEQHVRRMQDEGHNPAVSTLMQGMTYGLSDEIGAALQKLRGVGNYEEILEAEREQLKRYKKDNPIAATATEIGGAILNPVSRTAWAAQAPTRGARFVKGAIEGGVLGGVYGFNQGEGGLENRAKQGATSALVSAGVGGPINALLPRVATPGAGQSVAQSADNIGVEVPRFVVSDNRGVNAVGQAARQIPFIGSKIDDRLATATNQLETAANRTAGELAGVSGAVPDRNTIGTNARTALERGIDVADQKADAAFNALRAGINADAPVPVPGSVAKTLDEIIASRNAAGDTGIPIEGLQKVVELVTRPGGATFNGLQRARSELAKAIKFDQRNGGFHQGDLKLTYEALTDAMENVVRNTAKGDPDKAVAQFTQANANFAKSVGETREISRFLSQGSDERIVDRIVSYAAAGPGKGDLRKLGALRSSMNGDEWNAIAGYTLHRMGLNQAGEFSSQIFATNYGRMSEAGRNLLFGKAGTQTRQAIDDINNVAKRLADSQKSANFSNTGRGVLTGAGLVGATYTFSDPLGAASSALKLAAIGVPVVAFLSRPATASSMARWSTAYERLVRQPTAATLNGFNQASRNLSNTIGSQFGLQNKVGELTRQLSGVVNAGAEGQPQER